VKEFRAWEKSHPHFVHDLQRSELGEVLKEQQRIAETKEVDFHEVQKTVQLASHKNSYHKKR
jgi:hypothetical protein